MVGRRLVNTMSAVQQIYALHYLFTNKGERVVAHCLDLDLVVTGKNQPEAEHRLNAVVRAQFANSYRTGNIAPLYHRAPFKFWSELKIAHPLPPSVLELEEPPLVLPVEHKAKIQMPLIRAELTAAAA